MNTNEPLNLPDHRYNGFVGYEIASGFARASESKAGGSGRTAKPDPR